MHTKCGMARCGHSPNPTIKMKGDIFSFNVSLKSKDLIQMCIFNILMKYQTRWGPRPKKKKKKPAHL